MLLHITGRQVGTEEQTKLVVLKSQGLLKVNILGSVCFQQRIGLNQRDSNFQPPCAICNVSLQKGNIRWFNYLLGPSICLILQLSCETCTRKKHLYGKVNA